MALILTRREGQFIDITVPAGVERKVRVFVATIKGKSARIGIDAPADVVVHREEIQKRIDETAAAAPVVGKSGPVLKP